MKKLLFIIPLAISSLLAYQGNAQTVQWWDNNGASAATSGTWDETSSFWAPSATLTATPTTFGDGNFAVFAAGSTTITTLNINVPGTINCEGIGNGVPYNTGGVQSGAYVATLNFTGAGSINLPTGGWSFDCGGGSENMVINVPITGPGGIVQHNGGTLYLYGNNSYTGGTTATGGQIIYYNNNNSFGSGLISITSSPGTSIWCTNGVGDIVTLANAFTVTSGNTLNFVNGNTICTGPWTLGGSITLKDASAPSTNLTISGAISGPSGAGMTLGTQNGGTMILSGANTYSGPTTIGLSGATATVSLSSINSVTTPAQQTSSSLGVPSSAANGTIQMGTATYAGKMVYTGSGETSDRIINLAGTTGGATIEMDGAGPLDLTSSFTATGAGSKTLTLQGTSTAANTIAGVIPNNSSANKTALTKAQAGNWTLTGKNTFTGNTAISGGTLTIGGSGDLGNASYGGTISISSGAALIYNSSSGDTLSGVISGAGTIDEEGTSASTLTLSGANTFTGTINITSGTLAVNADSGLGAVPGTFNASSITLNGGPGANLRANANNIIISANRGITLGANGGAIQVAGNDTCTYGGIISGTGQFQAGVNSSVGLGVLVVTNSQAYTNTTVIAAGTLRLSATASIGNSSGIVMSNSPTLDVSAQNPFNLSTTNTFTSIGGSNTAPPVIFGASGGNINFGSQTINLSFNPAFITGDGTHSALTISQGTLVLDGNTINVTNASGLTLDVGDYALIQSSNAISVTATPVLNYVGPAMVANTTASLVVVGNDLMLQVAPGSGYTGTVFSNQSPSPSLTEVYGTANATFSGTVSASGSYPNMGESVNIAIGTVQTNTTTITDNNGDFSTSVPINEVPVGTYAITYSYPGTNSTLAPATDSSTALTITKALLTVTANAETKTYGQTLPTTGNTQFTPNGLQNGEAIGSVTIAVSGTPAGSVSNAPVAGSPYTITPSAATGGTFSSGNYSISYFTGQLTINPLPVGLKGTRAYDGTDTAIFSILSITNVVGTDVVNIASGSVTLASATPGHEPIASASGLTLGGVEAGDYTTAGAIGAVTITPATDSTNITATAAGSTLTLSWPVDHTGWTLQAQTNTLTSGISATGWVNVAGSTNSDQIVIPVDPNNGCVFYRLVYP